MDAVASVGLLASLLVGPVTWVGYSILLLPIFYSRRWSWSIAAAAVLFCVPYWLVVKSGGGSGLERRLGESIYGVAALLLLVGVAASVLPLPWLSRRTTQDGLGAVPREADVKALPQP
jgi:hypothetical protein